MDTEEKVDVEVLEIEGLEYDIGGAGAVDAGDTQVNHGALMVVNYR
jgi:hypothetical protein